MLSDFRMVLFLFSIFNGTGSISVNCNHMPGSIYYDYNHMFLVLLCLEESVENLTSKYLPQVFIEGISHIVNNLIDSSSLL